MAARKTKKTPAKKVTRVTKSSSGLGPVHFIMVGVTAAVLLAGFLFYQQNIQSPTSPKNELKDTLQVNKSEFEDSQEAIGEKEMVEEGEGVMRLVAIEGSKQSGTVTIEDDENGMAVVSVRLLGSSESKQTAGIHYGSCAYPGEAKLHLVDLIDGSSKTTLETSKQELLWGLPLSVQVHASTIDETVVACADITN